MGFVVAFRLSQNLVARVHLNFANSQVQQFVKTFLNRC